jgi:hypothetical protein
METQIIFAILECLAGAACGTLVAKLAQKYWR